MKVLLVGSGGREHALASALARSPLCGELHCAPGNPGIAQLATCHPLGAGDPGALLKLATELRPGLVVIGPEAPLVAGLADDLRHAGIPVFGPGRAAAALEGSKAFAKDVMAAAGVPTARHAVCTTLDEASAAIERLGPCTVIKADGLAAGKGVTVCSSAEEALDAARQSLVEGAFGEAGSRIVVEERLEGDEVSLLAICDALECIPLAPAQDFKRIFDDDRGPNTGGMGAYSPVPWLKDDVGELAARVHVPVLRELARRDVHFTGCLYAGLILTADGPKVLEFNVRFGDPETQAIVPRLEGDLTAALLAAAEGRLGRGALAVRDEACVSVVLASSGYPGAPRVGDAIEGIDEAAAGDGVSLFHAGTALSDGQLVTAGGRVLDVTAVAPTIGEARERAYAAAELVRFDGKQLRGDVARRAAEREAARARV
jgi:phosphoribosylamine--glycine ligase